MDGTIVDSEPYWIASEHALVAEFGGTWGAEDAHSVVGFDLLDAAVELRDRGGVDLEPPVIVDRLLDSVIAKCAEELPWRPGARELLIEARDAGVPCVLVTMSWRRLADAVLAEAPQGVFVGSVTGDEVANGKPAPDPYLAAAELIGVDPRRLCCNRGLADRCRIGAGRRLSHCRSSACRRHRTTSRAHGAVDARRSKISRLRLTEGRADWASRPRSRVARCGGHCARSSSLVCRSQSTTFERSPLNSLFRSGCELCEHPDRQTSNESGGKLRDAVLIADRPAICRDPMVIRR